MRQLSLLLCISLVFSCENNSPQEKSPETLSVSDDKKEHLPESSLKKPDKEIILPAFNEDTAYYFVKKQVSFGPRVISSKGWEKCSFWIENQLLKYTSNVIIQQAPVTTYDGKNHVLKNIIASFSPKKRNRIALFAHWDSRHIADEDSENTSSPILGANDGGSGVGVLLEIARQISIQSPKIGVDIILFDAEDYGQPEESNFPIMQNSWCLGSQYWSKNNHISNYTARYGVLLDMVGAKDATFFREGYSMHFAPSIVSKIWDKASNLGFGNYFVYQNSPEIIDDHFYVNYLAGIPSINIIEYDISTEKHFNKHWHTHGDNMNNINKETLNAVGETLLRIIYTE